MKKMFKNLLVITMVLFVTFSLCGCKKPNHNQGNQGDQGNQGNQGDQGDKIVLSDEAKQFEIAIGFKTETTFPGFADVTSNGTTNFVVRYAENKTSAQRIDDFKKIVAVFKAKSDDKKVSSFGDFRADWNDNILHDAMETFAMYAKIDGTVKKISVLQSSTMSLVLGKFAYSYSIAIENYNAEVDTVISNLPQNFKLVTSMGETWYKIGNNVLQVSYGEEYTYWQQIGETLFAKYTKTGDGQFVRTNDYEGSLRDILYAILFSPEGYSNKGMTETIFEKTCEAYSDESGFITLYVWNNIILAKSINGGTIRPEQEFDTEITSYPVSVPASIIVE